MYIRLFIILENPSKRYILRCNIFQLIQNQRIFMNNRIASIIFAMACYAGLVQASASELNQAAASSDNLTVLTFNIDTNIARTEEGYARDSHPQWRVGDRMPKICASLAQIIESHQPDVIHLQEGRNFVTKFGDEVDSIHPLMAFLAAQGYQVSTEQYNPSDRAFSFITAIKQGFEVDAYEKFYLSKTPGQATDRSLPLTEIKDNNFGEEWERCVYIANFHDAQGRKYRTTNVHLGISELHRKQACSMLQQDAQRVSLANPEVLQVQTGDMNTFPDWGGPAQLEIMKQNAVLQEVTENLTLQNGVKIHTTFIAFPFDFAADEKRLNDRSFKDHGASLGAILAAMSSSARKAKIGEIFATECKSLNGHLDRIYQHGFESASATLLPTPQFADFDLASFNEASVKDFIIRHHEDGPAFASDHQPIIAVCKLPRSNK